MKRTVKHNAYVGVSATMLTACAATLAAGAAAGTVAGWATVRLTKYHAEKTASAQEAAPALGYKSSDGTVMKIQSIRVTPDQVTRGQAVELTTDYLVLAPSENANVQVTEIVELWKDNKPLLKLPETVVTRQPGTWKAAVNFPVPQNAPAGTQ